MAASSKLVTERRGVPGFGGDRVDHHVFALAKLRKIIALFEKPFFRFVASFRLW